MLSGSLDLKESFPLTLDHILPCQQQMFDVEGHVTAMHLLTGCPNGFEDMDENNDDVSIEVDGSDVKPSVVGSGLGARSTPSSPVSITEDSVDGTMIVYDISGKAAVPSTGGSLPPTVRIELSIVGETTPVKKVIVRIRFFALKHVEFCSFFCGLAKSFICMSEF